jgi:hypothetical protein
MESSPLCECQSCHTAPGSTISNCIFQNIRSCLVCESEYQLNWNEPKSSHVFSCPNNCVKHFASKQLASINSTNVNAALPPWNRTLLHSAVQTCDVDLIWELLQKGANPFARDYRDIAPVDIAQAMYRNLTASTKWTTGTRKGTATVGQYQKQYCDRLRLILRIFPESVPSKTRDFIAPMAAKRVLSEGTNHLSEAERGVQSFPLPPDVVRSVTSPGRSHTGTFDPKISSAAEPLPADPVDPAPADPSPVDPAPVDLSHAADALPVDDVLSTAHPVVQPQGPNLEDGTQLYTPLTLIRLTSEGDGVAASTSSFPEGMNALEGQEDDICCDGLFDDIDDFIPSADMTSADNASTSAGEDPLLDWKIQELKHAVVSETEVEEKVAFQDGVYVCTACMEDITATSLGFSCPILGCHGTLCLDCFGRLSYSIIASAMYAVPVIRCPGGCMYRIPTKVWKGSLMNQRPSTPIRAMAETFSSDSSGNGCVGDDAGSIIYEKYLRNAKALMKLRCGNCHQTCDLFYGSLDEAWNENFAIPTTPEERLNLLDDILRPLTKQDQVVFLRTWLLFNKGKLSTETLTTIFYDLFSQFLSEEETTACQSEGVFVPLEQLIRPTLLLFCDIERRLCAQLGFYRKFPKIVTTCCDESHCFMCKVYGHHEGATCQEIQQNEIGIEAQVSASPPPLPLSQPASLFVTLSPSCS